MWTRTATLVGLFLVTLVLQTTVAPHLAVAGTPPDLVLVAVVALGLRQGARTGTLAGTVGGLALDLLRGRQLGLFALALAAAGGFAGMAAERVYPSRVWVRFAVALGAALIDQLLVVGLYALGRGRPSLALGSLDPALRQAVYDGFLATLVYGPLGRSARTREGYGS
jgi:rod shape-determining protein MreD